MKTDSLQPGTFIRFTYNHDVLDADSGDRYKEVLVLNPFWRGRLHGIDMKRLTAAEREVLQAVFDPQWKDKRHRLPLVNDVWKRMNPIEECKNPQSFYYKFVKIFLRNKDAYRRYWPARMSGVSVVKSSNVRGSVFNPKPLFKRLTGQKENNPPRELTPQQKTSMLDKVKQTAAKLFGKKKAEELSNVPSSKKNEMAARMAALKAKVGKK